MRLPSPFPQRLSDENNNRLRSLLVHWQVAYMRSNLQVVVKNVVQKRELFAAGKEEMTREEDISKVNTAEREEENVKEDVALKLENPKTRETESSNVTLVLGKDDAESDQGVGGGIENGGAEEGKNENMVGTPGEEEVKEILEVKKLRACLEKEEEFTLL